MQDIHEKIAQFTDQIVASNQSFESHANSATFIFLLGCYCEQHKPFLILTKELIQTKKIPCMLMSDVKIPGIDDTTDPDWSKKFHLICDHLLKSYRIPILFMYASKLKTECKRGAHFELVTICENQKYEQLKRNFRIFIEDDTILPNQEKHILFHAHVTDGFDFVSTAVKRAKVEIDLVIDMLQKEEGGTT